MSILRDMDTPVFKAEGIPRIDLTSYTLKITGMVEGACEIGWEKIRQLPKSCLSARLTSVSGWSVRADWEPIELWVGYLPAILSNQNNQKI